MQEKKPDKDDRHRILLGRFGAAHGIRGEVMVRTFTGGAADIAAYGPLSDKASARSFKLKVVRVTDKGVVARVDGITDRNGAETLNGIDLYVDRAKFPEPDEAEYYHADLIGLRAVAPDGTEIGGVIAVENFGAGDLLEIRKAGSGETEYVPFTNACVPEVNIKARQLTVIMPVMTGEREPEQDTPDTSNESD